MTVKRTAERLIGIVWKRRYVSQEEVTETTDQAGSFTINAGKVDSFQLSNIQARGYLFSLKQQSVWIFFAGTPGERGGSYRQNLTMSRDATFTMWRMVGKPEKLVVEESHFVVPKEGRDYLFNVFVPRGKGRVTKVAGRQKLRGDILFNVRDAPGGAGVRVVLKSLNGGLKEMDPNAFIAPQSGYRSSCEIDVVGGDVMRTFFVRSRGGKAYTRLALRIWYGSLKPRVSLTLNYVSNPTGSRNLQPGGGRYASHVLPKLDEQTWAAGP